jgi:hypothetical protein
MNALALVRMDVFGADNMILDRIKDPDVQAQVRALAKAGIGYLRFHWWYDFNKDGNSL